MAATATAAVETVREAGREEMTVEVAMVAGETVAVAMGEGVMEQMVVKAVPRLEDYQRVRHLTPDREIFCLREELKRLLQESDVERSVHKQEVSNLKEELVRAQSNLQKKHWRRSER